MRGVAREQVTGRRKAGGKMVLGALDREAKQKSGRTRWVRRREAAMAVARVCMYVDEAGSVLIWWSALPQRETTNGAARRPTSTATPTRMRTLTAVSLAGGPTEAATNAHKKKRMKRRLPRQREGHPLRLFLFSLSFLAGGLYVAKAYRVLDRCFYFFFFLLAPRCSRLVSISALFWLASQAFFLSCFLFLLSLRLFRSPSPLLLSCAFRHARPDQRQRRRRWPRLHFGSRTVEHAALAFSCPVRSTDKRERSTGWGALAPGPWQKNGGIKSKSLVSKTPRKKGGAPRARSCCGSAACCAFLASAPRDAMKPIRSPLKKQRIRPAALPPSRAGAFIVPFQRTLQIACPSFEARRQKREKGQQRARTKEGKKKKQKSAQE
nr:hypothetical protein [Pandoravirus massiliensis]